MFTRGLTMQWLGLALGVCLGQAAENSTPKAPTESYSGWNDLPVLTGGDCKAVLAPPVGGRIVCFAVNGENVLYQDPESWAKTLASQPGGFAIGGYQCDLGPEQRSIPEHPALWLGPWQWETLRPGAVLLRSQPEAGLGVQMEKEVVMDPDTGELGLRQRIKNISSAEVSYSLWDRTLCRSGGYALVPLSGRSRYKARWAIARKDAAGKISYEGDRPQDVRAKVLDHVLVVEARGGPFKAASDSDAGWVAYTAGRLLFIKYFPHSRDGNYSDGGNSFEFSCDEKKAELAPRSPEVKLGPGQAYVFPEKWALLELAKRVDSFAEARALVRQIPPSPFRK